jgi:V-type H+-transporting ATPase subunit F
VAGFCLAGVGHRDGLGSTNFLTVDSKTRRSDVEEAFKSFSTRKDVGIILINQHIADDVRYLVKEYTDSGSTVPTILEIPSVDHPYDPTKDSIMQRVQVFFGGNM